jgi:hypothetical protein
MRLEGFSAEDILHALAIAPGESAHFAEGLAVSARHPSSKLLVRHSVEMPVALTHCEPPGNCVARPSATAAVPVKHLPEPVGIKDGTRSDVAPDNESDEKNSIHLYSR